MKPTPLQIIAAGIREDADEAEKALNRITTKYGLLFRNGELLKLPEADRVAALHGFTCAERFVKHLEGK